MCVADESSNPSEFQSSSDSLVGASDSGATEAYSLPAVSDSMAASSDEVPAQSGSIAAMSDNEPQPGQPEDYRAETNRDSTQGQPERLNDGLYDNASPTADGRSSGADSAPNRPPDSNSLNGIEEPSEEAATQPGPDAISDRPSDNDSRNDSKEPPEETDMQSVLPDNDSLDDSEEPSEEADTQSGSDAPTDRPSDNAPSDMGPSEDETPDSESSSLSDTAGQQPPGRRSGEPFGNSHTRREACGKLKSMLICHLASYLSASLSVQLSTC